MSWSRSCIPGASAIEGGRIRKKRRAGLSCGSASARDDATISPRLVSAGSGDLGGTMPTIEIRKGSSGPIPARPRSRYLALFSPRSPTRRIHVRTFAHPRALSEFEILSSSARGVGPVFLALSKSGRFVSPIKVRGEAEPRRRLQTGVARESSLCARLPHKAIVQVLAVQSRTTSSRSALRRVRGGRGAPRASGGSCSSHGVRLPDKPRGTSSSACSRRSPDRTIAEGRSSTGRRPSSPRRLAVERARSTERPAEAHRTSGSAKMPRRPRRRRGMGLVTAPSAACARAGSRRRRNRGRADVYAARSSRGASSPGSWPFAKHMRTS